MFLPEKVLFCMQTLRLAGFSAYAVGGCVRDSLLGLTPHDYDMCTNALPGKPPTCLQTTPLSAAVKNTAPSVL